MSVGEKWLMFKQSLKEKKKKEIKDRCYLLLHRRNKGQAFYTSHHDPVRLGINGRTFTLLQDRKQERKKNQQLFQVPRTTMLMQVSR